MKEDLIIEETALMNLMTLTTEMTESSSLTRLYA